MKYTRPAYGDPNAKSVHRDGFMGGPGFDLPIPDYPIPIRENFRRMAKRDKPMWVPNSMTDINMAMLFVVTGMPEADFGAKERYDWKDWFGCEWTWVPEVGGSMLKPGTQVMDDITKWESIVKFPNLDDYDFEGHCKKWWDSVDHNKVCHVNINLGCTERLVALMGGYEDGMMAMAVEPEAVSDYLNAFVEWDMKVYDRLRKYLPVDFVTYHDDWGTERDTFFSEKYMESMVFEPTKRLFDHIHEGGTLVQLHSCGKIGRFVPYMIDLGVDVMQIQARANNIKEYKEKWGDKIGFEIMLEPGKTPEDMIRIVRQAVDDYGAGGGMMSTVFGGSPEVIWAGANELYYYSREKYDEEQGR